MRTKLVLALSVLVAALATAPSAFAASTISTSDGGLTITGGAGADNVEVAWDDTEDEYVVSDAGGATPQTGCAAAGANAVTCARNADDDGDVIIVADLGGDNDTLQVGYGMAWEDDGELLSDFLRASGGAGNDFIGGTPGDDELYGGAGVDTVDGAEGDDLVYGGDEGGGAAGQDNLFGGAGSDELADLDGGSAGTDAFHGGVCTTTDNANCLASPTAEDEADEDIVAYDGRAGSVTVNLAPASLQGETGENDATEEIEGAIGGDAGDDLTGNAGDNYFDGGPSGDDIDAGGGDDTVFGDAGSDDISGEAGEDFIDGGEDADLSLDGGDDGDIIDGGSVYDDQGTDEDFDDDTFEADGSDNIQGGDGVDTIDYSARTLPVTVNLGGTSGYGQAGENDGALNMEAAVGGDAGDTLTGGIGENYIAGGAGDDTINTGNDEGGFDEIDCGEGLEEEDADTANVDANDELVDVDPGDEEQPDGYCEDVNLIGDPVAPPAPTGLVVGAVSGAVFVDWNNTPNTDNYQVWRSVNGGNWVRIATVGQSAYVDNAVTAGTHYCYTVYAVSEGGDVSAAATFKCAATPAAAGPGDGDGDGGGQTSDPEVTLKQLKRSVQKQITRAAKLLAKGGIGALTDNGNTTLGGLNAPSAGTGTATLGAGGAAVASKATVIAKGSKKVKKAGSYKVKIKLTKKGKKFLRKKKKVKLFLTIRFKGADGKVAKRTKKVTLKR